MGGLASFRNHRSSCWQWWVRVVLTTRCVAILVRRTEAAERRMRPVEFVTK
jgi:hypothetical protein